MEQTSESHGTTCTQCQHCLADRTRCLLCRAVAGSPCAQIPQPVAVAKSSDTHIVVLKDDSAKAAELRQWFLSKWYGRSGVTIRIDSVIALFSAPQTLAYHSRMEAVLRLAREVTQFAFANERRMFLQLFPATFCELWVPTSPASSAPTIPPCTSFDVLCEACLLMRGGPGALCKAGTVLAVHDPFLIESSLSGASICSPDDSSRGTRSSIQRRLCIICRVVLGNVGWLNDLSRVPSAPALPTVTKEALATATETTATASASSPNSGGVPLPVGTDAAQADTFDSYVVEEQTEKCFYAFPDVNGVLPTYCIVFSMRE